MFLSRKSDKVETCFVCYILQPYGISLLPHRRPIKCKQCPDKSMIVYLFYQAKHCVLVLSSKTLCTCSIKQNIVYFFYQTKHCVIVLSSKVRCNSSSSTNIRYKDEYVTCLFTEKNEPHHGKTNSLHRRKQRRRSASR